MEKKTSKPKVMTNNHLLQFKYQCLKPKHSALTYLNQYWRSVYKSKIKHWFPSGCVGQSSWSTRSEYSSKHFNLLKISIFKGF